MALLLSGATTTDAYPVANAVTLDELAEQSDVIFKGTLLRGEAVVDDSFRKTHGFDVHESVFRVVSVLKGDIKPGSEIRFRHFLAAAWYQHGTPHRANLPQLNALIVFESLQCRL